MIALVWKTHGDQSLQNAATEMGRQQKLIQAAVSTYNKKTRLKSMVGISAGNAGILIPKATVEVTSGASAASVMAPQQPTILFLSNLLGSATTASALSGDSSDVLTALVGSASASTVKSINTADSKKNIYTQSVSFLGFN